MKKLGAKGMKTLKVFHLLFVMVWLVGVLSMWVLNLQTPENGSELKMLLGSILWIDHTMTIPGAMLTVLTGIIYGAFTNYGFFKLRWITVKWIVGVAVILSGTFIFHPDSLKLISIIESNADGVFRNPQMMASFYQGRITTLVQGLFLVFLVVISVFKPWRKTLVK